MLSAHLGWMYFRLLQNPPNNPSKATFLTCPLLMSDFFHSFRRKADVVERREHWPHVEKG